MRWDRVGWLKVIIVKIGVDCIRGCVVVDFFCYIRCYIGLKEIGKGY